jgi:hypothetical protein
VTDDDVGESVIVSSSAGLLVIDRSDLSLSEELSTDSRSRLVATMTHRDPDVTSAPIAKSSLAIK